jgi:hypothetical protein
MQQLVEYLAKQMAEKPDEISVEPVDGGRTTIYEVSCAEGDAGKIIGRQGRVIRAIRTVVKAAATRTGERVDVDVV